MTFFTLLQYIIIQLFSSFIKIIQHIFSYFCSSTSIKVNSILANILAISISFFTKNLCLFHFSSFWFVFIVLEILICVFFTNISYSFLLNLLKRDSIRGAALFLDSWFSICKPLCVKFSYHNIFFSFSFLFIVFGYVILF